MLGGLLFGGTFMVITMLAVSLANDLYPQNNRRVIGLLATFFGLGQMIGPLAAGRLIVGENGYYPALVGAAAFVLTGALGAALGMGRDRTAGHRRQAGSRAAE